MFGHVPRHEYVASLPRKPTPEELRVAIHAIAFAHMGNLIERAFRERWPTENTLIIAEDQEEMKKMLRAVQSVMRSAKSIETLGIDPTGLPFRHIRDTVHFAGKRDSRHLQLADACAYFIRGTISGNQRHWPFHDVLAPQMIAYPKHLTFHHDRAMKKANPLEYLRPWDAS